MLPPFVASWNIASKWFRPAVDLGPCAVEGTLEDPASFSALAAGGGLAGQGKARQGRNKCRQDKK